MNPLFADVPTMMLMLIVSSVVTAGAIALLARGSDGKDGLGLWASGLLCYTGAHLLLGLRGRIPDELSIVLGNMLLCSVLAFLNQSVRRFYRLPSHPLQAWVAVAVTGALTFSFLDDFHARLATVGFVGMVQGGQIAWTVVRHRRDTPGIGSALVLAAMLFQMLVFGARGFVAVFMPQHVDHLLQGGPLQTVTYLGSFVIMLTSSLGFVFMCKDRADETNRRLATLDALTGLANRRSLITALERDVARSVRTGEPVAVLMMDIDHFKRINDEYGHPAGDAVICRVAQVLSGRLRSQDIVGRYGGEEFLAVLPATDMAGAYTVAAQLIHAVANTSTLGTGVHIPATISIGVAGGVMTPGDGWDMLVAAADRALYRAKEGGRNRAEIESELRRASPNSARAVQAPQSSVATSTLL